MNLELKTLHVFIASLFALFCAICLSCAFYLVGVQIRTGMDNMAASRVEAAKFDELAARHEAIEALHSSVKWAAVVDNANRKTEAACELLPKKQRKKVCAEV